MTAAITNNVAEISNPLDLYALLLLAPRVAALCHICFSSLRFYLVVNSVLQEHGSMTLQQAVLCFK